MPLPTFSSFLVGACLLSLATFGLVVVPIVGRAETPTPAATVTIDNFVFTPKQLTVPVGAKVVWTNRDDIPHTIVGTGGARPFKSPPLDTDNQFSITFDRPGTYKYFCSLHPMMTGTIVVQ